MRRMKKMKKLLEDASLALWALFHSPRPSFLPILPSSPSLLPPRLSFLLISPSSSSLFFPQPALSKSFKIRKSPFFINFDKSITDRRTNQPTNQPMDKVVQTVRYSSCSICSSVLRSLQERMQSSRAASAELRGGISPRQNTDVTYVFKIGTSCTFFILRS